MVFESDECFGHESEQEMLQGEGDQVETDEELIPDHDMLHCYPPAPSSSSPLPHVPHVEPEWHPPLPVEQTIQALTPSTELNSGSSMRLAPLLLAAITSTTSTSTRDESATRRIPTICGGLESEEFSTSSNHCREEASEEARPEGRQNPIGRKVRLEQGRTCGSSGSMGTGLREPHADEGRGSLSGRNGHGRRQVCETCWLRILYVPVHGVKGIYRSAGWHGMSQQQWPV